MSVRAAVRFPRRLWDVEAGKDLTAAETKQVRDGARLAEGQQRRVDAVLEHRSMANEMEAKPGPFPLGPHPRCGEPDRGHRVATAEFGEQVGVDLVGLGGQWRDALGLRGVRDLHIPTEHFECVVNEPGTSHRFDDSLNRLTVATYVVDKMVQAVGVRREGVLDEAAARLVEDADVKSCSAEIESSVQNGMRT